MAIPYGIHVWRNISLFTAARMTADDIVVAATCPERPGDIWRFIMRDDTQIEGQAAKRAVCEKGAYGPANDEGREVVEAVPTPTRTGIAGVQPTPFQPLPLTPRTTAMPIITSPTPSTRLQTQLPRSVWEEFESSLYGTCSEPAMDSLKIVESWSSQTSKTNVSFVPSSGTYFLVVAVSPDAPVWQFDSVLTSASGDRFQSLHVDSSVPTELTDAQEWCSSGFVLTRSSTLNIEASGVQWMLYLVAPEGSQELPQPITAALGGYYSLCPALPPIEQLQVLENWNSQPGVSNHSLEFSGTPPFFFLGVAFEPTDQEWEFRSTNVSGDWTAAGPRVSSRSSERIDFTATCPSTPSSHHLDVESRGGTWSAYLIGVPAE